MQTKKRSKDIHPTRSPQGDIVPLPRLQSPGKRYFSPQLKPHNHPWQAIIFDMDDTLYPEREYVLSGFRAVAAWVETNLHIPAEQGYADIKYYFDQGVRGNTFNRWLATYQIPADDHISTLIGVYRNHQPAITPFPEVPNLLQGLAEKFQLGLVSDGYLAVQQRKLGALNLKHYFNAVVFSDEWGRKCWKPNPKPFQVVLERLQTSPEAAVYVADNPLKDFLGARQVGMDTVWIRRDGGEYTHLTPPTPEHAPNITLNSLSALHAFLLDFGLF